MMVSMTVDELCLFSKDIQQRMKSKYMFPRKHTKHIQRKIRG